MNIYIKSIYIILLNKSYNIHRQDIIFFEDCILSILSDSILTQWSDNSEMLEKDDGWHQCGKNFMDNKLR